MRAAVCRAGPSGPEAQLQDPCRARKHDKQTADDHGEEKHHSLGKVTVQPEEGDTGGLAVLED
jgi:hypothetical protein